MRLVLVGGGLLLAMLLIEGVGRIMVKPCDDCWGRILGVELPRFEILAEADFAAARLDQPYDSLVVDGIRITMGDLYGVYREDSLLGYAPLENARSTNGWYVTNRLGARSTRQVDSVKADSVVRVLVFGDSFAAGSRVREFETWSDQLERKTSQLDVVNFGVDGYSMAQAYLRYSGLKEKLEHDWIIVLFPPTATLWRDINSFRNLFEWGMPMPVPRFVVDDSGGRLVRSPYATVNDVRSDNLGGISPRFREYLRRNDSFYLRSKYERPAVIGHFITYKIVARIVFRLKEFRLHSSLKRPGGEAMRVSKYILDRWVRDAEATEKKLLIAITPASGDVWRYRENRAHRESWDRMKVHMCTGVARCIDLMDGFLSAPDSVVDKGYDGTHHGPRANGVVAEALWGVLASSDPAP